ncbi:MAG: hypothetical protein ABW003_10395 [Microvirga sp.]
MRSRRSAEGGEYGQTLLDLDAFKGDPILRRVGPNSSVKIDQVRRTWIWDARPVSWPFWH